MRRRPGSQLCAERRLSVGAPGEPAVEDVAADREETQAGIEPVGDGRQVGADKAGIFAVCGILVAALLRSGVAQLDAGSDAVIAI